MHPQDSDRFELCKGFFQTLEACHANAWLKWTGGCNEPKHELNMCLRQVRLDRSEKNRAEAKIRREKIETAWAELHKDD